MNSMTLVCKVTPNSRESACAGWSTDAQGRPVLLVKLAAPPVDGRANDELVRFLAVWCGCPRNQIAITRGASSRTKTLQVPDALAALLPNP